MLEGVTSRRPNFFVFLPIEVPKEPRWGFLDAMKPLEQSMQSYTEGKQSQIHFDAEKLLRRRRCRTISGRSRRPFCVSFSLQGSRDLE